MSSTSSTVEKDGGGALVLGEDANEAPSADSEEVKAETEEIIPGNGDDAAPPAVAVDVEPKAETEAKADTDNLAAANDSSEPADADGGINAEDGDEAPPAKKAKRETEVVDATAYALPPDEPTKSPDKKPPSEKVPESGLKISQCSCAKSKCLKLYCDCLTKGNYCNEDCECNDCHNTPEHDGEGGLRLESIRYILSRKPDALTDELRAMAYEGGWEPPAKPPRKSPSLKRLSAKSSSRNVPTRASAGRTVAKSKNARSKDFKIKVAMDDHDYLEGDSEYYSDEDAMPAIAYATEEFPQLALDESQDFSDLASSFKKPLFDEPSRALEIAYSHHTAAKDRRKLAQKKKNDILKEYNKVRDQFMQKKLELSLANDEVKGYSREVGAWTRKVFDLELEEPSSGWNASYKKLKDFRDEHGRLPFGDKKANDEEEKTLAAWLNRIRTQRNIEERDEDIEKKHNKNKRFIKDYPHRLEALADLGVVWESHNENKWEIMFQKLLIYKEEMGTLRFPSDDQCAATGDEDLISLQKWAKGQVTSFRYGKKRNPEVVKKLLDIGFDFEKWYAKPTKNRKAAKDEKLDVSVNVNDDTIAKSYPVEEVDDRKMPALADIEQMEDAEMVDMNGGENEEAVVV